MATQPSRPYVSRRAPATSTLVRVKVDLDQRAPSTAGGKKRLRTVSCSSRKPASSHSYFAGSCGDAPLTVIRQHIEGQKRPT